MKKILSISIAAYNVEQFLDNTLNSMIIENDDVFNKLEVIIVNDGSKDNTLNIAKKYQEKYPNVFVAVDKENGGYGSTINRSLELAKGKYFKLIDGDDWCNTEGLESLIKYLEKCDADMVVTKYCLVSDIDGSQSIIDGSFNYDERKMPINNLGEIGALQMHYLSFKTDVLRNSKMKITEKCFYTDVEYILKPIPYVETVSFHNSVVYMYRIGREGQSVSIKSWQKNIDMALTVTYGLIEFYSAIENTDISDYKKRYIYRRILESSAGKYKIFLSFKPSKAIKKKMIDYDRKLLEMNKELYLDCRYLKIVRLVRSCNFIFYRILSFMYRIHLKRTKQI